MTPLRMWAIANPRGRIFPVSVASTAAKAWERARLALPVRIARMGVCRLDAAKKAGFRAVRVTVTAEGER